MTASVRFRNRKYSISAYIEKIFHQSFVKETEGNYLTFLWRDNPNLVINEHKIQMCIQTFGENNSPSIEDFSPIESTKNQQNEFPNVIIQPVVKEFFMVDFFKSNKCVKYLINTPTQLLQLLFNKSFILTKWKRSSQLILDQLPSQELEIENKL